MSAPTPLVRAAESNACAIELRRPETVWWNTRPGLTHQIEVSDWRAEMHSTRRCSVDGCDRSHYGKGLCKPHYNRHRRMTPPADLGARACDVDGCGKTHYARGLCRLHWERNHKHGDPLHVEVLVGATIAERLARYSTPVGECIEWTGYRDKDGYGRIEVEGSSSQRAPRVAYEEAIGPIPDGLMVRHRCDNPPCIRIEHLELGTNAENQRDKADRARSTYGTRNPSVKLTAAQVIEIRDRATAGEMQKNLATEFGIGQSQISRIIRGESWSRA